MHDNHFIISTLKKIKLKNPILIEGLPGMGNVGKITADFLIAQLKAQRIYEIRSSLLPNFTFVNQDNLLDTAKLEIAHKKIKNQDFLILTGDAQPVEEQQSYAFCEYLIDFFTKLQVKEIITLGGIGLEQEPVRATVYITGNNLKLLKKHPKPKPATDILLGPIMGMTGLLPALSTRKNLPAITLITETVGQPGYIGAAGAKALLGYLNDYYKLKLNLNTLNKEIKAIQTAMKDIQEFAEEEHHKGTKEVTNYIG